MTALFEWATGNFISLNSLPFLIRDAFGGKRLNFIHGAIENSSRFSLVFSLAVIAMRKPH